MAEKKVNYGVQGIEDLVSDLNNSKDQNGEGQSGAIAIPSRKATGRPTVRKMERHAPVLPLIQRSWANCAIWLLIQAASSMVSLKRHWSSISRTTRKSTESLPCLRYIVIYNK